MKRLLAIGLTLLGYTSVAQDSCSCCDSQHKRFDFWVGEWAVYDTLGVQIGTNTVTKSVGDCVIMEHWQGSDGSEGKSINFFETGDKSWNQIWVDNSGSQLVLKGEGDDGVMTLRSDLVPGQKFHLYRNQITWTLLDDGSVTQVWQLIDRDGQVLTTVFHGVYKSK